jgi:RimJ/RimL family protein N-acetyltransferase
MKITFKKFAEQDLPLFLEWAKRPHVKDAWFVGGYEPIDKYDEKIVGNGYDYSFIICLDNNPVGYIQCSDLYAYKKLCPKPKGVFTNEEPGAFCLDLFIGEEEYLNKGYGAEIVKLFVDKLFAEFKAKKILIDPACSNKRAIRCYEKAGFEIIKKEHDGVEEVYIMAISDDKLEVLSFCPEIEKQAYEFLNKHEETALFLLSNLQTYGSKLTDDTYSGNFKCLLRSKEIVAVFALTRIGNLIVQTDKKADYSKIIFSECLKETVPFRGVIGDWEIVKPVWDHVKTCALSLKEKTCIKEILFRLSVEDLVDIKSNHTIKCLEESDYSEWGELYRGFVLALKLNMDEEDEDARRKRFSQDVNDKNWFGLFVGGKLVSMAAYIAHAGNTGQIGSVFTASEMRGQGLMKELVAHMVLDGKNNKHMKQVVLFTAEDNNSAIKLYEYIGFKRIGFFGQFFGEIDES